MKVAITGSGGHYGIRLTNILINQGHSVHCLLRSEDQLDLIPDEANIYIGDVTRPANIKKLIEDCDAVVHLAYGNSGNDKEVNIESTKNIFDLSDEHQCKKFIFISSLNAHRSIIDKDADTYFKTKNKATEWLLDQNPDFSTLIIYPVYTIGPGDYKLKRFSDYRTVISNKVIFPPIYDFSKMRYLHIDEVMDAIIKGLNGNIEGECILSGKELSKKEYYKLIAKHSHRSHYFIPIPKGEYYIPSMLSILSKLGVLPDENYSSLTTTGGYPIPDHITRTKEVKRRSIKSAVEDSVNWYKKSGLI